MKLEQFILWLRIDEGNRKNNGKGLVASGVEANVVKHNKSSKNAKKDKQKLGPKGDVTNNKFHGKCINCGKNGHKSSDYKALKRKNKSSQAIMVEQNNQKEAKITLSTMVAEINLVGSN